MTPTPDRSLDQRRAALEVANRTRLYRSKLKADLAAGARQDVDALIVANDPLLRTMHVEDLLRAVPGLGEIKVEQLLRRGGISTSKTIAGLNARQRGFLLVELSQWRETRDRRRVVDGRRIA
jgi:hypothetical protein